MRLINLRSLRSLPLAVFGSLIFAVTAWFMADSEKEAPRPAVPIISEPIAATRVSEKSQAIKLPIMRVEPDVNQTDVSTAPKILAIFRESAKGKTINIKVTPAFDFSGSFDTAATTLTVTPTSVLQPNTKYSIEVMENGTVIYGWSFTTGEDVVATGDLASLNRLKESLPYRSTHFWIEYKAISDTFNIYIDAQPIETYRQQALNYFKSQGINDPTRLKISVIPVGDAGAP